MGFEDAHDDMGTADAAVDVAVAQCHHFSQLL